jgi:hypothetical protein
MDKYLIKYLVDTAETPLAKKYLDFFKVELDWHLYVSKTHMSKNYFRNRKQTNNLKILSTVYFPNKELFSDLKIDSYSPVWHPVGKTNIFGDLKTLQWHKNIQHRIRNDDFNLFLDATFQEELETFQQHLLVQYQKQDFRALFLYTDQYFYSKYNIDIFKKMNRPSFIFTHGMPGIYNLEVDNRADYLMVWSEKIKQNYVRAGFSETKLKVVGNPKYGKIPKKKTLRSNLTDVLVLPVSSVTWHQHTYGNPVVNDASLVILYLYQVQHTLQKLGVKKARYRSHPSINQKWIHSFLDPNFYSFDDVSLTASLKKSSLVIGSNSTVVLEALMHGVNYIAYDPKDENGVNMSGYKSVPPFDGSEEKLMMSETEVELQKMIKGNAITDYTLVHDYIQDFDLSVLKDLIN